MPNPKLEQIHIEQFAKLSWPFPVTISAQPTPEPDFLVEADDKRIGIEHTQLIRLPDENGINFMAHSRIANKIMHQAELLFNQTEDFCLMVHVDFRCDYGLAVEQPVQLYNNDIQELTLFVAKFVAGQLPVLEHMGVGGHLNFDTYDWDTLEKVLPDKINGITIYNTRNFNQPVWSAYQGSTVPGIYESVELAEILKKKNNKPQNYKGNYSEIWLLIVEDSMDLTSYFHFDDQTATRILTPFDRVFILRRAENTVHELEKTDRP